MHSTEYGAPTDASATPAFLASKITGVDFDGDDDWFRTVENMLSEQRRETLEELLTESTEFNQYHWQAVDNAISDFIYGGPVADSSFGEDEVEVSREFFLRLAFNLAQLLVEEHLPMLYSTPTLNWSGEYDEPSIDEMNQSISNAINYLAVEMVLDGRDLKLARGLHLYKTFTNYEEIKLDDETLLWMSGNSMVLLANALQVFGPDFDRGLAEEIVRVEAAVLREGVL